MTTFSSVKFLMKHSFFILLLLIPMIAFCTDKRKEKNKHFPVSRWKEVKSLKTDSVTVQPVDDTLFIAFRIHDSFDYHGKNGFIYRGLYIIDLDDSTLDFGYAKYKLLQKKPEMFVVEDDKGIYQFGIDSSDTVAKIVLPIKDSAYPVTDIDQMIGHWTVYKRTADGPVGSGELEDAIKAIYITGQGSEDKLGYIYCSGDADDHPSWYVTTYTVDQILDCDGKGTRSMKVLKCQKGEMILQEKGMKYYLKQFK